MAENYTVFPQNCSEALALIYVQAQDLSEKEPVPLKDLQVPPTIAL